jgi:hypothetical protein
MHLAYSCPKSTIIPSVKNFEHNDGVLDETTAPREAGGSGIDRAPLPQDILTIARLIAERIEPCLDFLKLTWDDVMKPGETVLDVKRTILGRLGPRLVNEPENLPRYMVQIMMQIHQEAQQAKAAMVVSSMGVEVASGMRESLANSLKAAS